MQGDLGTKSPDGSYQRTLAIASVVGQKSMPGGKKTKSAHKCYLGIMIAVIDVESHCGVW